ncbi:hypothetical protein QVD17_01830 [Tagetes erecta]|uniref:Mitochondrial ATP synthase subunit G protein n=1 Tax=Tagetes erecta TaxID=13708 RepID=A0AAD8L5I6_TARER|nr:hypothetical protein QVD17_01830 [Tagetes erecta]
MVIKCLWRAKTTLIDAQFSKPLSFTTSSRRHCSQGVMTSKLQLLRSKAAEASKFLSKNGSTHYKQTLEQNKKYIMDPPTIEKCQQLSEQLFYTRLASIPSRYDAFWKEVDHVKQLIKTRKDLKTEDMGIGALFGLECFAWYCAGEIIGRGFTVTGYYV